MHGRNDTGSSEGRDGSNIVKRSLKINEEIN
jgi:hypothetical protein